jgi:hypothetical protein
MVTHGLRTDEEVSGFSPVGLIEVVHSEVVVLGTWPAVTRVR